MEAAALMSSSGECEDSNEAEKQGCCQRVFQPCCDYSEPEVERDDFWDNYKGLAQLFICLMHTGGLSGLFSGGPEAGNSVPGRLIYGFVSFMLLVSMPSFCFISGFLSSSSFSQRQRINLVRYSVTWFIQHAVWVFLFLGPVLASRRAAWEQQHPNLNATNAALEAEGKPILTPPPVLPLVVFEIIGMDWYLWCVVIWRVFLPLLVLLPRPLLASFILSFGMVFTDAFRSTYSMAVFSFMPFFVLGFIAHAKKQELIGLRGNLPARVALFVVAGVLMFTPTVTWESYNIISRGMACFYGGQTADQLVLPIQDSMKANFTELMVKPPVIPVTVFCQTGPGMCHFILYYLGAIVSIFGMVALVPADRVRFLTRAGRNSIYIYFGQIYFITVYEGIGVVFLTEGVAIPPALAGLVWLATTFIAWSLLSQPCFKCCYGPCVEPRVELCCIAAGLDPLRQEEEVS